MTQSKNIGLIYVGKEICVDVYFDVDQDVNNAYVEIDVPPGVEYSRETLPRGSYNTSSNVWNIGSVTASEDILAGSICFVVTDESYNNFPFKVTAGVSGSCEGCDTGNVKCINYTGISCSDLENCTNIMFVDMYEPTYTPTYVPTYTPTYTPS